MGMTETLKAVADADRRKILDILKRNGKMTAGDIAKEFHTSQATVSYHLSKLKKAELICETKYKNYIYYELNISVFEEIVIWIKSLGGEKNEK